MKLVELHERYLWGGRDPEHDFDYVWKNMSKVEREHFVDLAYDILERDYGHELSDEQLHSLSMNHNILADVIDNYDAADDARPDSAILRKTIEQVMMDVQR